MGNTVHRGARLVSLFNWFKSNHEPEPEKIPELNVTNLQPWAAGNRLYNAPYEYSYFDGDKFFNGFGHTQIQLVDYWSLRQRSAQLFQENLYARGIIRRLINNEINTGLCLESIPEESVLGLEEDSLGDWSEIIETRFSLWARSHRVCDYKQLDSFYSIQKAARIEALVTGDCLVVLRQTQLTQLPTIQLISGNKVQTPLGQSGDNLPSGNKIRYGVEIDEAGRQLAYYVIDDRGQESRYTGLWREFRPAGSMATVWNGKPLRRRKRPTLVSVGFTIAKRDRPIPG